MGTARAEIVNIFDSLPARYNIGEVEVVAEPIAQGMFGSLHRGHWGGRAVAVKKFELNNTDDNFNLAAKEMSRMIRLRHQNVLHVYGFFFVPMGQVLKCSMVMELMDLDLDKYVEQQEQLTDDEMVYVMTEIARGMKHVHENGYVHRDLKPQNVLMRRLPLLGRVQAKVADFGSSELMSGGECDRTAGTLRYKAPEQFVCDSGARLQPDKMDVYSFGCTCFKLWTGEDPPVKNHTELLKLWEQRCARNLPGDVEGIIKDCLRIEPDERPGFTEISGALDAVLKKRHIEQVPSCEEVSHIVEREDVVARREQLVRLLKLDPGEYGVAYADWVVLPEELIFLRENRHSFRVREVVWKGTTCALKYLTDLNCYLDASAPGFKRLPTLIHENIVRFFGYSSLYGWLGHPGILMEYLDDNLGSCLEKDSFPEQKKWMIMKGIAEGMRFLHGKGLVHGDLKPPNVMVNSSDDAEDVDGIVVKLIDFNLTWEPVSLCSLYYAAPEVLRARVDHGLRINHKKADVYSFAITCSDILRGGVDHSFGDRLFDFKKGVVNGLRPELPEETSEALKKFIKRCWHPKPARRPSFGEICAFFSQPQLPENPVHVHARCSCTLM